MYAASMRSCRPCLLREQCQWSGSATAKPRQVSVLLHPLFGGSEPVFWRDWSRRFYRRACRRLVRHQCVEIKVDPPTTALVAVKPTAFSRAERAHYRLSWTERLARNARPPNSCSGDDSTVRRPRKLCHLARPGDDSLNRTLGTPRCFLASDRLASPSESLWPLFLALSPFHFFSALFVSHTAASVPSDDLNMQICTTFAHLSRN